MRLGAVILTLATLAAYANSFSGAFQFDDFRVIVLNPEVKSLADWWGGMPGMRSILKLSFTLNEISGLGPAGFHLLNLLIHLGNILMVLRLCKSLAPANATKAASFILTLSAGAIFALHPANTEAVTYISGRSASLMTFFYLASLVAHDAGRTSRRKLWHLLSAVFFLLALATKETAATLPAALLLRDIAKDGRDFRLAPSLRTQALHWAILGTAACVFLTAPVYRHLIEVSFNLRPAVDNLLTHINAVAWLTRQWFWPFSLNADPRLPEFHRLTVSTFVEGAAIAVAATGALLNIRRHPVPAFGVLWYLLQMTPPLLMARLDPANERQLYLAGIGLAVALGWSLALIPFRRSVAVTMAIALLLAGLTVSRNRVYSNEIAFWSDVARKSPHNARAFNNLGYAYRLAGMTPQAEAAYIRALEIDPDYLQARFNLQGLRRDNGSN